MLLAQHASELYKDPSLVQVGDNLFALRFESMKVWSALQAVRYLLKEGIVRPGDTLIDSSSGTYAYGLALACHRLGMKCHIIASKIVDPVLLMSLHILGAKVEQVDSPYQAVRIERVKEIAKGTPGVHWMKQYHESIHYKGYSHLGEDMVRTLGTDHITLVGPVGTGVSTGGIASSLRVLNEDITLVGVDRFESVLFGSEHLPDDGLAHAGSSMGSDILFSNVHHPLYDKVHWLSFELGASATVALFREHVLFGGLSGGCSYLVASYEARENPERAHVFIMPDTGHRYLEAVYAPFCDSECPKADPLMVPSLDALERPWSCFLWGRREKSDVSV